jgi:hypothetical protein
LLEIIRLLGPSAGSGDAIAKLRKQDNGNAAHAASGTRHQHFTGTVDSVRSSAPTQSIAVKPAVP